jgi:hypothetical protein
MWFSAIRPFQRKIIQDSFGRCIRSHKADQGVLVRSGTMTDIIMLAIGLGFFALSVGYAYACERL